MFEKSLFRSAAAVAAVMLLIGTAQAADIETVPVGNLGNTGEWSGESYGGYGPDRVCGAVDYAYNIGTYEVTAGQYCEFLNAVAGSDPHGLYDSSMDIASAGCQITQYGGLYGWCRGGRGGSFYGSVDYLHASRRDHITPASESWGHGFRVASIPEPGSITLLVCGLLAGLMWWRCRR